MKTERSRIGYFAAMVLVLGVIVGGMIAPFTLGIPAQAQTTVPGLPLVPLGYCQIATLTASTALSSCVRASFTGTGSGTNLTVTSVSGIIKVGDLVSGTGVTAGTKISSQTSGTTGGAGVYVTSVATTSSSASLTSGGIPLGANAAFFQVEAQAVRYRDDGAAPTAAIGMPIAAAGALYYAGSLSAVRVIEQTSGAKLNILFYK